MIEKGRAERWKIEIYLIKLKWSNEIRNGDVFSELIFLLGNIQKFQ
jgi:hypothetical protein